MLKKHGVKRGDRVTIYLPMIPEAAYAMLACARIGAVHSVVFGGFSPEALAGRIEDAGSDVVVTADEGLRGGKRVPLKHNVDLALEKTPRRPCWSSPAPARMCRCALAATSVTRRNGRALPRPAPMRR